MVIVTNMELETLHNCLKSLPRLISTMILDAPSEFGEVGKADLFNALLLLENLIPPFSQFETMKTPVMPVDFAASF